MKLTKKIFSLFLCILVFATSIQGVLAMYHNDEIPLIENSSQFLAKDVNVAVIAYSEEIRDRVCNSISSSRNSIIGQSPVDNKYYKINFVKLPPYHAYCNDNELRKYISDNESKITKCCGCMFIYDLSKVYDSYDGPLLESWKMRENGYGNKVKEECRRWCHAIEEINPERFFLFIPDKRNLHNSEDKDFWGEYACDQIGSYCEHLWLTRYPSHGQFVSSITIPRNDYNIISNHLLQIIPNHNHIRNLFNYFRVNDIIYKHPIESASVGVFAIGALCGIGYGIYSGIYNNGEYL